MRYFTEIIVTLIKEIRDVQGEALDVVLNRINLENQANSRVGKFFTLEVEAESYDEALEKINNIAKDTLSNPVLEQYKIVKVEEICE